MTKQVQLTKNMTEAEFDNGFWYTGALKTFAREIGIPNNWALRKDELERVIKEYLRTGVVPTEHEQAPAPGPKDYELGLSLDLPIRNYVSNKETKHFIEREIRKIKPNMKQKSGVKFRLNRWREEQLASGNEITYGDLIREYIRLNESDKPFEKLAYGRYSNFIADYLANEPDAMRAQAIEAWNALKELDIPKDYESWKRYKG